MWYGQHLYFQEIEYIMWIIIMTNTRGMGLNLNIGCRGQPIKIRNEVETQMQEELDPKGSNPGHHIYIFFLKTFFKPQK